MDKPGRAWCGMALKFRHNRPAVPHGMPRRQFAETARAAPALPASMRCSFLSLILIAREAAESCCGHAGTRFLLRILRRVQADLNQLRDQIPSPMVYVVLPDDLAHAMHSQLLLL